MGGRMPEMGGRGWERGWERGEKAGKGGRVSLGTRLFAHGRIVWYRD